MNFVSNDADRDPVAAAIEELSEMRAKGMGRFRKLHKVDSVMISFGDFLAEGRTMDIALVRLASAMMDEEKYTRFLMER